MTVHTNQDKNIHLLSLPEELLIQISISSGFWGAISLMGACRYFRNLLKDPSCWSEYGKMISLDQDSNKHILTTADKIENVIDVTTIVSQQDRLSFGIWHSFLLTLDKYKKKTKKWIVQNNKNQLTLNSNDRHQYNDQIDSENDDTHDFHSFTMDDNSGLPKVLFFEHESALNGMESVGGLVFIVQPSGAVDTHFFDSYESLHCYIQDFEKQTRQGKIPMTLNFALREQEGIVSRESITSGVKFDHECQFCEHYHDKKVLKSGTFSSFTQFYLQEALNRTPVSTYASSLSSSSSSNTSTTSSTSFSPSQMAFIHQHVENEHEDVDLSTSSRSNPDHGDNLNINNIINHTDTAMMMTWSQVAQIRFRLGNISILLRIHPVYEGRRYHDLPWCTSNNMTIEGRRMTPEQYQLFRTLAG